MAKKVAARGGKELSEGLRAAAKGAGLSVPGFVVLRALAAPSCPPDGMSYRGIEAKTGYYSVLTALLRKQSRRSGTDNVHADSLGSRGLVREVWRPGHDDQPVLHFQATAKGRAAVAKVEKAASAT